MSEKVPPPSTTPVAAARRRKTGGSLGEALVGVRVRRFAAIGHVRPSGVLSVPTSDAAKFFIQATSTALKIVADDPISDAVNAATS